MKKCSHTDRFGNTLFLLACSRGQGVISEKTNDACIHALAQQYMTNVAPGERLEQHHCITYLDKTAGLLLI